MPVHAGTCATRHEASDMTDREHALRRGAVARLGRWIAVAYQNLTARHRLPKPRGKDRRYRIHFGPDEAR